MKLSTLVRYRRKQEALVLSALAGLSLCAALLVFVSTRSVVRMDVLPLAYGIVQIANIGPQTATVYWKNNDISNGTLQLERAIGEGGIEIKHSTIGGFSVVHISRLKSETKYAFWIRSRGRKMTALGGAAFSFTTPANGFTMQSRPPAYGVLYAENGLPVEDALVSFETDGYYPLITSTKETGEWLIPLSGMVQRTNGKLGEAPSRASVTIRFYSENRTTLVRTFLGETVPLKKPIVHSGRLIALLDTINTGSVLAEATSLQQEKVKQRIGILYPQHNAIIPGAKPLIKGVGIPGKEIQIRIDSTMQYTYRTVANSKGEWLVQQPTALPPGSYTLTLKTPDTMGRDYIEKRRFSIIKSGESVLGEASQSAKLTPSPTTHSYVTTAPSPIATVPIVTVPASTIMPTYYQTTPTPPTSGMNVAGFAAVALFLVVFGLGLVVL